MRKFLSAVAAICVLALPGFARQDTAPGDAASRQTAAHSTSHASSHRHHGSGHSKNAHPHGKRPHAKGH
jgi:hypothetical protein